MVESNNNNNDYNDYNDYNNYNNNNNNNDRFSLKVNTISMTKPSVGKSKKRKLSKPSKEDGRRQTSISSFFGASSSKKNDPIVEAADESGPSSVSSSRDLGPSSVSSSPSPRKSDRRSVGPTGQILVSTLDGFVSTSPRKAESLTSSPSTSKLISIDDFFKNKLTSKELLAKEATSRSSSPVAFSEPKRRKIEGDSASAGQTSMGAETAGFNDLPDEILETIFCQIPHAGKVINEYSQRERD